MSIEGIKIEKSNGLLVVFIENFSNDLKELIRKQLSGIFNGYAEVNELPHFYSYKYTLASFLDRYNSKSEDIKKGMIGELLAHILINSLSEKLRCLSILKNKEERSIKKGFDIVYYHKKSNEIWYTEVKSGRSTDVSSDDYNLILLNRAKSGISTIFESKRVSLWESAIIDVKLVVEDKTEVIKMKKLLEKHAPLSGNTDQNAKKNAILVSVLYHSLNDKLTLPKIIDYYTALKQENLFKNSVIFSIQKEAFEKVELFLQSET